MKNVYGVKILPKWKSFDPDADKPNEGTYALWSGNQSDYEIPPAIGERVNVDVNKIGPGVVESYFVEAGFLGVNVVLDKPIPWNDCKNAMSFGCEISRIKAEVRS